MFYLFFPNSKLDFGEWDNILVESHGLLFDILLFGIGIAIYDEVRGNKQRIKRYSEELEDYRGWTDNEASFRVAGIVKRLEQAGINDLDYSNLHIGRLQLSTILKCISERVEYSSIAETDFKGKDLSNVTFHNKVTSEKLNLRHTTLNSTDFKSIPMSGSFLTSASGIKTDFRHAKMKEVYLGGSTFVNAKFDSAILTNGFLERATFDNCTFRTTDLSKASLIRAKFINGCNFTNVILDGAKVDLKTWKLYLLQNPTINSRYSLDDAPHYDTNGGYDEYYIILRHKVTYLPLV